MTNLNHINYKNTVKDLKPGDKVRIRFRINPWGQTRIPAGYSPETRTKEGIIEEINEDEITLVGDFTRNYRRLISVEKL